MVFHSHERGVSLLNQWLTFLKSTKPLWTQFIIILQDFTKYNAKRHHYFTAQTHENIRIERQASDTFLQSAKRGSLVTVVTCMSPTSSVTCISKIKYETRTDEWITASINPRMPSLGLGTERDFHPFLHFTKHTKPTQEDPVNLIMDGHYSHTRNLEVIILVPSSHKM